MPSKSQAFGRSGGGMLNEEEEEGEAESDGANKVLQVSRQNPPNEIKVSPFIRPDTLPNKKPTVGTLPFYPHMTNMITPAALIQQNTLLHQ